MHKDLINKLMVIFSQGYVCGMYVGLEGAAYRHLHAL